jgi:TonB-dependent receptor
VVSNIFLVKKYVFGSFCKDFVDFVKLMDYKCYTLYFTYKIHYMLILATIKYQMILGSFMKKHNRASKVKVFKRKHWLKAVPYACSLGLALQGFTGAVYAEDSLSIEPSTTAEKPASKVKKNEKQAEFEQITVTGQKVADVLAINAKRFNDNIIEALSTNDLGQFPDNNLSESIGRMSGVSTILDEGVGRYVSIRGLDPSLVNVGIDGSAFSSTTRTFDDGAGRAANMEALSADFIGEIEVAKSVSADMDGDSIGGSINFVSKSAFSMKEGKDSLYYLHGAIGKNTSDEAPFSDNDANTKLILGYTGRFGSENQFGVVFTANQKDEDKDVFKKDIHSWDGRNLTLPSGAIAPLGVWDTIIHETGKKEGSSLKVEYWPSDEFYGFASVIYSDEKQNWRNGGHVVWNANEDADSYDEETGEFSEFWGLVQNKNSEFGTDGLIYTLGGDWSFDDDKHQVSVRASNSSSKSYLDEQRFKWGVGWKAFNGTYASNGRSYSYDLDAESDALFENPDEYAVDRVREKINSAETAIDTMRIDWSHNLDGDYGSFGFKTGAKFTQKEYVFIEAYADAKKYQLDETYTDYIGVYDYESPSASNQLLFADLTGLTDELVNDFGSVTEFITTEGNFKSSKVNSYTNANNLNTDETVNALYFMGMYNNDDNLKLRAGLRYEETEWNGKNRLDNEQDADFVQHSGKYEHLLPSLSATFEYSDSLVLRAAFSQTVGRPGMEQYAAKSSIPNDETGFFYRSNPDLKPRESDNYDLSLEQYFDKGNSLFSFGLFAKDITNEIYDQQSSYLFDKNGDGSEIVDAHFIQPTNAGSAKVEGFEVSYILTSFDFLPEAFQGLGFRANWTQQKGEFTTLDSEGSVERKFNYMPKAPETIYNLSLTYDDHGVDARLSYQFQGERAVNVAEGADATREDDLVRQDSKRLDLHIGYQVNDNVNIYFDGWNLTEAETTDQGYGFWDETTAYGSSYWLGTKISF